MEGSFDKKLNGLERLDLIKTKSIQPDLEYIFKHALTQEVIYNALLKKDRREIHERIGVIIEQLFQDRLPEFYETLAFHYSRSRSVRKAVDYLMKSAEKSLKHYAVEESHKYFDEAYALILDHFTQSSEENELRIDLLNRWALVYYYRGDFIGLTELYKDNLKCSESLPENSHKGMFIAWLGAALTCRAKFRESYEYFQQALTIGDNLRDDSLVGFVSCWLPWCCSGLGLLDEAIMYGERAQEISKCIPSDHYVCFKSLGGLALAYFWRGAKQKVLDYGKELVDFGRKHSNIRSQAMGLWTLGLAHMLNGDAEKTIDFMERSVQTAADPFYAEFPRAFLGIAYVYDSQWDNAEKSFNETIKFTRFFGAEVQERWANMYLGIVMAAKGRMSEGIARIEKTRASLLGDSLEFFSSEAEFALGKSYLQMVVKKEPVSLKLLSKNIGFLVRTLPFAADRAEIHFRRVYELAKKYGSDAFMGHACLGLGLLHKAKKRNKKARDYLSKAIKIFEKCEMTGFADEAGEALESIR